MIWGESNKEKNERQQKALKAIYDEVYKPTRFAWFPTTLDNGKKVWLERYYCVPLVLFQFGHYSLGFSINRYAMD